MQLLIQAQQMLDRLMLSMLTVIIFARLQALWQAN